MNSGINRQLEDLYNHCNGWCAIVGVENLSCIQSSVALPKNIGLYRFIINGVLVYVGRATEKGKGLSKRLFDYTRNSDSARKFNGGWLANLHQKEISVEIVEIDDVRVAKILEVLFIEYDRPLWNSRDGLENWLNKNSGDMSYLKNCKDVVKARKRSHRH